MKKMIFIASAALLCLAACADKQSKPVEQSNPIVVEAVQSVVSSQVAYINIDSLLVGYDLYAERNAELTTKATKAENELTNKTRSLEKMFADAQQKVEKGLVTRTEAMQLQQDLEQQERSLYEHREKVQVELAEEAQVLMNNIINNIDLFLEEFNADYRYGMILTTSGGSPVLHADPRLNITAVVLQGLNEKYAVEKKAKVKK